MKCNFCIEGSDTYCFCDFHLRMRSLVIGMYELKMKTKETNIQISNFVEKIRIMKNEYQIY